MGLILVTPEVPEIVNDILGGIGQFVSFAKEAI